MKYVDLFAGIGGFRYGIKRVYADRSEKRGSKADQEEYKRQRLQPKEGEDFSTESRWFSKRTTNQSYKRPLCVYSNEWDKYANSVYRKHYGECDNRDIRTVKASEIPDHDLLCGGFPCQSFSVAGKRGGFNDTRGTLFFEIARIAHEKQPRLLLLENVKGLLNHDSGRTFATILFSLDELGYDAEWQVLNSKNFGVPQNRERVFIIGHLRGTSRPQVFPLENSGGKDTRIIGQDVAYTIDANYHKGTNTLEKSRRSLVQLNQPTHSNDRVYGDDGIAPTLNTMQGGRRQPKIKLDAEIRRLTPVECERLQGFPDNWTAFDADGKPVSDTQRYKMCGNAVTTNVITEIVSHLDG